MTNIKAPSPQTISVGQQEAIDFLYEHSDLTYSAAAKAVNLLAGNGYGFTSGKVKRCAISGEVLHIAHAFAKSVLLRGAEAGDENARQLVDLCSAALATEGKA